MRRRLFNDKSPEIASSLMMLAVLRVAESKYPEALELAQNARSIFTAALSADHWRTAIAESIEGAALTGLGRYPEAEDATHARLWGAEQEQRRRVGLSKPGTTLSGHVASPRALCKWLGVTAGGNRRCCAAHLCSGVGKESTLHSTVSLNSESGACCLVASATMSVLA